MGPRGFILQEHAFLASLVAHDTFFKQFALHLQEL